MRSWWGEWQRSTHLTRSGANTVNLHVPSSLHTRTHAFCSTVMCVWSYPGSWSLPAWSPVGGELLSLGCEGFDCNLWRSKIHHWHWATVDRCVCVFPESTESSVLFSSAVLPHVQTHICLNCQKNSNHCCSGYAPASFILWAWICFWRTKLFHLVFAAAVKKLRNIPEKKSLVLLRQLKQPNVTALK